MDDMKRILRRIQIELGYYDFASTTIELLFLKYITEYVDELNLNTDQISLILSFKRKFDLYKKGKCELTVHDIAVAVSTILNKWTNLCEYSVPYKIVYDAYNKMLYTNFNANIWQFIDELDILNEKKDRKELIENILEISSRDKEKTGSKITSKSIRELANKILKINKDDVFIDCFSGLGTMSLSIDGCYRYYGYELDFETGMISLMINIMLRNNNFYLIHDDKYTAIIQENADKLFSEGPLDRIRDGAYDECFSKRELTFSYDVRNIYDAIRTLNDKGTGVVIVSPKILYSDINLYSSVKKELVENGLKAVILLPCLSSSVAVNTVMIVIEKGYDGDICFIDASKMGVQERKITILSENDINEIVSILESALNRKNIAFFANRTNVFLRSEISPSLYVEYEEKNKIRSLEEIENELEEIYCEIRKII